MNEGFSPPATCAFCNRDMPPGTGHCPACEFHHELGYHVPIGDADDDVSVRWEERLERRRMAEQKAVPLREKLPDVRSTYLFAVIALVCIPLTLFLANVLLAMRQQAAVQHVTDLGGDVKHLIRVNPRYIPSSLYRALGPDFFCRVVEVSFRDCSVTYEDIAYLNRFPPRAEG